MTPRLPSLCDELSFAAPGPLHRVHTTARPLLDDLMSRHGNGRVDLDGTRMGSRAAMHAELARAMALPGWYGGNWDAFNDCFGSFLHDRAGEFVAIVVHDAERIDPAAAFELGVVAFGVEPTLIEATPFHVFAVGDGPDYGRPDR